MTQNRPTIWEGIKGCCLFLVELIRLPLLWRARLEHSRFFELLNETEAATRKATAVPLPPAWVVWLVRARVRLSSAWRSNRCLLSGLLLYYFLPRAGQPVTLHLGCRLQDGKLLGHCWVEARGVSLLGFQDAGEHQAVVSRTLTLEPKG